MGCCSIHNHGLGDTERRRKRFILDRELLVGSDSLGFGLKQEELIAGFSTNGGGTAAGPRTGKVTVETMVGSSTVAAKARPVAQLLVTIESI